MSTLCGPVRLCFHTTIAGTVSPRHVNTCAVTEEVEPAAMASTNNGCLANPIRRETRLPRERKVRRLIPLEEQAGFHHGCANTPTKADCRKLLSTPGTGRMADIADDKSHRNVEGQSPTSPAQTSQQPLIQADSRSSNQQRRNTVVFHMEQCQYALQEHGMTAKVVPGSTLAVMNKTFPIRSLTTSSRDEV